MTEGAQKPEKSPLAKEGQKAGVEEIQHEMVRLEQTLQAEKKRADDYLNRLKYLQADFENCQKQARRNFDNLMRFANERLIIDILDILESLEQAVENGRTHRHQDALLDGLDLIVKRLWEILKSEGVEHIEALGKPFDPSLHEASDRVRTENSPDNTVLEEVRRGYLLFGKVIRPSLVKVAHNPSVRAGEKAAG